MVPVAPTIVNISNITDTSVFIKWMGSNMDRISHYQV